VCLLADMRCECVTLRLQHQRERLLRDVGKVWVLCSLLTAWGDAYH
jgi:hypothetical protein